MDWSASSQRMYFLVGEGEVSFTVTQDAEGFFTGKAWRQIDGSSSLEALDKSPKFNLLEEAKLWCETYSQTVGNPPLTL